MKLQNKQYMVSCPVSLIVYLEFMCTISLPISPALSHT